MDKEKENEGKSRGPDGRILLGHKIKESQERAREKEEFRRSVADVLGLAKDDPIVGLVSDLGASREKKDRVKAAELLVKKLSPKKEEKEPVVYDPLVSKIIDHHVKCIASEDPELAKLYYGDDCGAKRHGSKPLLVEKLAAEANASDAETTEDV